MTTLTAGFRSIRDKIKQILFEGVTVTSLKGTNYIDRILVRNIIHDPMILSRFQTHSTDLAVDVYVIPLQVINVSKATYYRKSVRQRGLDAPASAAVDGATTSVWARTMSKIGFGAGASFEKGSDEKIKGMSGTVAVSFQAYKVVRSTTAGLLISGHVFFEKHDEILQELFNDLGNDPSNIRYISYSDLDAWNVPSWGLLLNLDVLARDTRLIKHIESLPSRFDYLALGPEKQPLSEKLKILAVVISLLGIGFCLGVGFLLWIWKDPLSNSVDFHKVQRRYDLFHLADNAFAAENKREKENASFLLSAFATVFWHCLCKMLLLF